MSVGFIGRSELLFDTIKYFIDKNVKISFVYTFKSENNYKIKEKEFKTLCKQKKIPFFCDTKLNKNHIALKKLKPFVGVTVNCPFKIKKNIINIFPLGLFNCHLGDLPQYRGNATPNWAIINNEKKIALCLHKVDENIDTGPIFSKKYLYITNKTYIGDIYKWAQKFTPILFYKLYKNSSNNKLKLKKQTGRVIHAFPREPGDHKINWNTKSDEIIRLIRASSIPFSGDFNFLKKKKIKILRAKKYKIGFDNFFAIPGQVCFLNKKNPVISTKSGMIEIEQTSQNLIQDIKIKKMIGKSLRNRLK